MKLTTRGHYSVKALLDWATSTGPGLNDVDAIYTQIVRPR